MVPPVSWLVLQDDVDDLAERVDQVEKGVEQLLAADRGGQHGNLEAGFGVAVGFDPETFARGKHLEAAREPAESRR